MVDFTLQKEWERSTANMQDKDYLLPRSAHNDYLDEPGELEKMKEDLANLKRPDAGKQRKPWKFVIYKCVVNKI